MNKTKTVEEFKGKSADFINGKLSPIAFDEWFEKALEQAKEEGRREGRSWSGGL